MKKKILITMMLCVCVFGLTACNKQEEIPRTLEVAFKEEQKEVFDDLRTTFIEYSEGLFSNVDIIGNEFIITSVDEEFESIGVDEEYKEYFTKILDYMFEDPEMFDSKGMVDDINSLVDDYYGNTIITIDFLTPGGDEVYSVSFDENGIVTKEK